MVQSIVAVTAGSLLTALPPALVHRVAGVVFLVFAWSMWRRVRDDEEESLGSGDGSLLQSATGAFMVIFVAEWGDLTQLATATLVARYQQTLIIFVAATLALWAVTGLSVLIGSHLRNAVHPQTFQRIAAVLFATIGAYILATV